LTNAQVVCQQRADCLPICDQLDPALRAACRRGVACESAGRGVKTCTNIPF
jgi:hypothetical protein